MSEPRTEAGQRLVDDIGYHAFLDGSHIEDRVVAIEDAAARPSDEVTGLDMRTVEWAHAAEHPGHPGILVCGYKVCKLRDAIRAVLANTKESDGG